MSNLKRNLKLQRLTVVSAAVAALTFTTFGVSNAQTHGHEAEATTGLVLNHGSKWETDAPLRTGMSRIRTLVEPQLAAADAGKLDSAQFTALAGQIEGEVGGIVANCKLEPEADAVLHVVVGEILSGTEAMAGKSAKQRPEQGLVKVANAINGYAGHFDHPDFVPITSIH